MVTPLFILAFTCYILSIALAFAGSIFSRKIPTKYINITISIHVILLIICVTLFNRLGTIENPSVINYLFLIFFCLGIASSGIIIRSDYPIYLKTYFLLFLISIPLFIVSPSRVLGFIITCDIHAIHRNRIQVKDNYFLVAQSENQEKSNRRVPYKLIREMGMFHRTMQRDIMIPEIYDSLHIMEGKQDTILIRFFFSYDNIKDSIDQSLSLIPFRDSSRTITRQSQKIKHL